MFVRIRCLLSESCLYLQLGYHASDVQPRIRWAIVYSGLRYMVIYIPRTPGRPRMYCSPVMRFCLRPDDEQEPAVQPPIWSILVRMLLVETRGVQEDLKQRFGLVVPIEDPSSSNSGSMFRTIKRGTWRGITVKNSLRRKKQKTKDSAQREFEAGPNGAIQCKARRRGIERNHNAR